LQAIYILLLHGKKEVDMQVRSWLKPTSVLALSILLGFIVVGCGIRGVKRAPMDTLPDDADAETKIEILEAMAAEYPEDANVYFELGNLYYDQLLPSDAVTSYEKAADVDSARALLEEALTVDPGDAKAYNNLGMIHYTEMDVDGAVKHFKKALQIDPRSIEAHYNLGLAFAESGLLLEAIREWRIVLELDQESEMAQRARLSLDRAEKELKR
jgi:tetratricopeptide (TPR) repeat protein